MTAHTGILNYQLPFLVLFIVCLPPSPRFTALPLIGDHPEVSWPPVSLSPSPITSFFSRSFRPESLRDYSGRDQWAVPRPRVAVSHKHGGAPLLLIWSRCAHQCLSARILPVRFLFVLSLNLLVSGVYTKARFRFCFVMEGEIRRRIWGGQSAL